jgi:hypothetical protein
MTLPRVIPDLSCLPGPLERSDNSRVSEDPKDGAAGLSLNGYTGQADIACLLLYAGNMPRSFSIRFWMPDGHIL